MDTLYFLQHYWWALVALLGAILVFLLFVQGAQGLLLRTASSEEEKDFVVKYAGHKWEITFTTLVTFGGAAFASFPLFYSTSFGGAYWLWICILLLFVIQSFSFEYRKAAGNLFGARTFEIFLFLNGALGTFLLGVAVGTFFTGGAFTVDKVSITDAASPAISRWANGWHGLDALANPMNLLLGVVVFLAARTLGLLYLLMKPDVGAFAEKCRKRLMITAPAFVLTFVAFVLWMFLKTGDVPQDRICGGSRYRHNICRTFQVSAQYAAHLVDSSSVPVRSGARTRRTRKAFPRQGSQTELLHRGRRSLAGCLGHPALRRFQ